MSWKILLSRLRLEPSEGKLSRWVLRRGRGSDALSLIHQLSMEQALRCYFASSALAPEQLSTLTPQAIPKRWNHNSKESISASAEVVCALALDPQALHFRASVKGVASRLKNVVPHSYTQGLWEADVVELFLVEGRRSAYYEINLAPDAAWWSQSFTTYRTPNPGFSKPNGVQTQFAESDTEWSATIRIPRSELPSELSFSPTTRANFCAILGSASRTHYSLAPITTTHPDFHQSLQFLPLQIVGC